jgi:hypothetical protein
LKERQNERQKVTGRRKRRRKQLLYDVKETRRSWNSKEEALDRSTRRTCFGKVHGPVARQRERERGEKERERGGRGGEREREGEDNDVNCIQTTWPFWAPRCISHLITAIEERN